MKRKWIGILIAIAVALAIATPSLLAVLSKYESSSSDASSVVVYGHKSDGVTIAALNVDTNGNLIISDRAVTKIHKTVDISAGQTGAAVWTPSSGKTWVLKDIILTLSTGGLVTIFDGTDNTTNRVVKAKFSDNGGLDHAYAQPREGSAADSVLKYTSDSTAVGSITVEGYEY